jgi:hypothetical protein
LSNLLREFLGRQSSGSVDLDHAVPAPSKWPFPLLRQRLEEASYDPLSSVIARSIADFDTVSQPASAHCPAKTGGWYRRGPANAATSASGEHRDRNSRMNASARTPARAVGSPATWRTSAFAACAGHAASWLTPISMKEAGRDGHAPASHLGPDATLAALAGWPVAFWSALPVVPGSAIR